MNRKALIGVVVLMAISLVGNIVLQGYWIEHSIHLKEEQFDAQVQQALKAGVSKLETQETVQAIAAQLPALQASLQAPVDSVPTVRPLRILGASISSNKKVPDVDVNARIRPEAVEAIHSLESLLADSSSMAVFFGSKQGDNIIWSKVDSKANQLRNVMEQIALESIYRTLPVERRLAQVHLDTVLQTVLKNEGIDLPFEYGIISEKSKALALHSPDFDVRQSNNAYKTFLFPHDIIPKPEQLLVYFPQKQTFLLYSLRWTIGSAFVFTLIILITFFVTISVMLRQKKLSDVKTDFINNMSHEFKTPLATISLATDSINNPKVLKDPNRIRHYTSVIKEENKRMHSQVEHVLQMALLDRNALELQYTSLSIHHLIEKVVNTMCFQSLYYEGNITCRLEAPDPVVTGDPVHLQNVLTNLLDNAVKYSFTSPQICIRTRNEQATVVIQVQDQGIGMSKDKQRKIFEKFYRISTGNMHTVKGFGLGLSYAKAIVEAHKGNIAVQSEPGKGSIFEVRLPISTALSYEA